LTAANGGINVLDIRILVACTPASGPGNEIAVLLISVFDKQGQIHYIDVPRRIHIIYSFHHYLIITYFVQYFQFQRQYMTNGLFFRTAFIHLDYTKEA
jgi:hypothetical protein